MRSGFATPSAILLQRELAFHFTHVLARPVIVAFADRALQAQ